MATTHPTVINASVLEPYLDVPRFINGDFDFTHLEIDETFFSLSSEVGEYYYTEGNPDYDGMIYYGRQGDLDGDGNNELVISGWAYAPNETNTFGRIYTINFNQNGDFESYDWATIPGTAAPWVADFDDDGNDEILAIGFFDFPVKPAQSIFFDEDLSNPLEVGLLIDSHESTLVDYDGDGDLDVVAITYNEVNGLISLFKNEDGVFEHKYLPDTSSYIVSGSSIEFGDIDGDGIGEFIVGDYNSDAGLAVLKVYEDQEPNWAEYETILPVRPFFEHEMFNGIDSKFTSGWDASEEQIVKGRSHDVSLKLIDLDNDGDNDLINATEVWSDTTPMAVLQILINDGSGNFTDETFTRLFNFPLTGSSGGHDLEFIDFNNDGFTDIYIPEGGTFNSSYHAENESLQIDLARISEVNRLLLNDGEGFFLNTTFAVFGELTDKFYPNKWYPIQSQDGTFSFVQLDHAWDSHPDGGKTIFNMAKLDYTLYTGPDFVNPATLGAPGFNEFYVLRNNPNVQELVKNGEFDSALDWYAQTNPGINTFAPGTIVWGSTSNDKILLREDNETAHTLGGTNLVQGGSGNDTIYLTADATWSTGYSAKNVSNESSVGTNQTISLEALNRFNDVIDGGDDMDTLNLTAGNDAFFIDDVYSEHHSSLTLSSTTQGTGSTARAIDLETINAGEGNDLVDLTSSNFILNNAVTINGEAGNDTLWGSNGDDVINGGDGNDTIFGGTGNDALTGGLGADTFEFTLTSGNTSVTDFNILEGDTLRFYNTGGANFDKDSIKSNSAGDGISIDYIHDKQTYSLDITLGLKNNQIYSSGSLNENSSNGAWFDRSLEVYGLELVLAGNVGGQSAVPDEWAYKVAETVKFLINPYVSEVNDVSQSNLIKTLLGDSGTWHNGFQTAQRIANGEGDMYSPNPLQNPESYVGYEPWLDSHMQNDMIWYQNETTTDNNIVEVLEHLMHTIHPFGVRGAVDGSFDALMGSDIEVESSQEYKSKDLYLAMKQAMDNGVFNPDYIDAPDNVLLKEYTYLLNFGMWEFGKEFWDDDENGEGSLAPEWGDNARTPDGILSNNPLGYQLFNAYFDPVLTRPEPQALREIFQNIENGSRYLDLIQPLPASEEFLLHVEIVIV